MKHLQKLCILITVVIATASIEDMEECKDNGDNCEEISKDPSLCQVPDLCRKSCGLCEGTPSHFEQKKKDKLKGKLPQSLFF